MAPKKSIPSKNPISHHGSSFSSFLPSRDRFRDSESRKDFEENFCHRAIYWECLIVLSDFLDTFLPGAFSFWGLESLRNPLDVLACLYRSSTPT